MIATLNSEWIKLRTVRVHAVLVIIAVAFPLLVVGLVAVFTPDPDRPGNLDSVDFAGLVTGTAVISAILFGVVAAIGLTGEFSHGTIRPTFAATPSHVRVLGAKMILNSVVAAVGATVLVMVCWSIGALVLSQRGASVSLSLSDGSVGALAGLVALSVVLAWFGFGIALLVRNSPAAVSILLLWPLFAESLLGGVLFLLDAEGLVQWLPYQAGLSVVSPSPSPDSLGRPLGVIWFGVISLALVGLGLAADRRRDA